MFLYLFLRLVRLYLTIYLSRPGTYSVESNWMSLEQASKHAHINVGVVYWQRVKRPPLYHINLI